MSLQEMVHQVSYVTDPSGQPTAVQVQIEVWEQLITLVQQLIPAEEQSEKDDTEQDMAWDAFLTLAEDAQVGTLENPSIQHDTYLYGQAQ